MSTKYDLSFLKIKKHLHFSDIFKKSDVEEVFVGAWNNYIFD